MFFINGMKRLAANLGGPADGEGGFVLLILIAVAIGVVELFVWAPERKALADSMARTMRYEQTVQGKVRSYTHKGVTVRELCHPKQGRHDARPFCDWQSE